MKKIILILILGALTINSFSQGLKPVAQKIADLKTKRVKFTEVNLFEINSATIRRAANLSGIVTESTVLEFNQVEVQQLLQAQQEYIRLIIPVHSGLPLELELFRSNIFTPDFSVTTSASNGQPISYTGGLHYWGIINGNNASIAAISIFNDEVMGMVSSPYIGNLVLGKLANDGQSRHILYNDANLKVTPGMQCFTAEDNTGYQSKDLNYQNKTMVNCLRLFWEVNYDIFLNKGSVTNAANYVTGLFNQSAVIYTNDGIPVELSEVYVWNTTSPYTATTTSAQLALFKSTRNAINGDLGHLLGLAGGGGIAAGFNGICNSNLDNSQCYSMIYSSYSNVPTYSWSVMVVTHEQGHLMGSRHTHACVWNSNNTAIDNCGPTAGYGYEGSCNNAPTPVGGGTIMSYCHAVGSIGINFSNGFGPQPAAVIINKYNNGLCLTACLGTSCMPSASMTTSNIASTTTSFSWNTVSGAIGYNIRYRIVGSGTWTMDTTSFTTFNATGLTPGSNYEWQVQTICTGGTSIFTISANFTTIPLSCLVPGGTNTTNIGSTSATFNWMAVGGASSYSVQYRIVGSGTWTTVVVSALFYNVFSLTGNTDYEWQVRSTCVGGGTSAYSSSVLFTTLTPPCLAPQNIYTTGITDSSATLNWMSVAGATGYYTRHRIVGTTNWINNFSAASPLVISGLQSLSNYEWQIMITCTGGQSPWGNSSLFTTLCTLPTAVITANGPTTICSGSLVLLTASSGINYAYQWFQNGNILNGMVSMNYPASTSGNYTVLVSANGCSAISASVSVIVNPLPSVNSTNVSGCEGTAINLSGSPAGGTFSLANPYTGPSATYTYTYTDSNGCSNTSAASTITVNPLPLTSLSGLDSSYMINSAPVTLTGSPAGGTFSGPGISGNTFDPSSAGIGGPYTIIYSFTDSNNCSNSTSHQTTVINCSTPAQPSTIYIVSGSAKVCPGDIRTYRVTNVAGISYNWIPPLGAVITNGQGTNKVDITYTSNFIANSVISVTPGNTCGTGIVRTQNVNRNNPATPSAITGPINGVCALTNVPYATTAVNGISYNWSFNVPEGIISSGQGSNAVTADFLSNYSTGQIRVAAVNGCGSSAQKTLTIKSVPAKPGNITGSTTVCANQQTVPYAIAPVANATTYKWTAPNGARISDGIVTSTTASLITTASSVTINFKTTAGNVSVRGNNACGYGTTQSLAVAMPCRLEGDNELPVNIYPNPSSGDFIIDVEPTTTAEITIRVYDAIGKLVLKELTTATSARIKNESLVPGIYIAVITNGSFMKQVKLVKTF